MPESYPKNSYSLLTESCVLPNISPCPSPGPGPAWRFFLPNTPGALLAMCGPVASTFAASDSTLGWIFSFELEAAEAAAFEVPLIASAAVDKASPAFSFILGAPSPPPSGPLVPGPSGQMPVWNRARRFWRVPLSFWLVSSSWIAPTSSGQLMRL